MNVSVNELISAGFAFGFALTVIFWGLLIPVRWMIRHLGL